MKSDGLDLRANKCTGSHQHTLYVTAKACLTIVLFILYTVLFYRQAVRYNGVYFSDLPTHIELSVNGGSYSFLFFIMGMICRLSWGNVAVAMFESGLIILTFLLAEKYTRTQFRISSSMAVCISAGMLFLSSIYIPEVYPYFYCAGGMERTLITQPWHNITYFGMRLFSVPVFFHTLDILERYRTHFTWKDWLSLAFPLLLGAAIKPNFLVDYSLTLLCVLIVDFAGDFLRKELNVSSFMRYVSLGSVVFPAVAVLFYQMFILFGDQPENGIAIVFFSTEFFSQGIINIGIIRDIAFPLLAVIYGLKHFSKKREICFAIIPDYRDSKQYS